MTVIERAARGPGERIEKRQAAEMRAVWHIRIFSRLFTTTTKSLSYARTTVEKRHAAAAAAARDDRADAAPHAEQVI